MVDLSRLCYECKAMLDTPFPEIVSHWKPLHETLDKFQKAILQGCYFCNAIWRGFSVEHRDAWENSSGSWMPLMFMFRGSDEKLLLHLYIGAQDPIVDKNVTLEFRMISHDCKFGTLCTYFIEQTHS